MADHEDVVRDRLADHSGVSALVSTRIWYSRLPDDPTLPALSVQQISGVPVSAFGDDVGEVELRVQVDAWDDDRAGAKALAEQVRDALQRFTGSYGGVTIQVVGMNTGGTRFEPDGRLWRTRQDFELWGSE